MALAHLPGAVFLDSSSLDYGRLSKWSFISACPRESISFEGGQLVRRDGSGRVFARGGESPFKALRELVQWERCDWHGAEGPPLVAGPIGYLGYELGRFIEELPARPPSPVTHPEMWFGSYSTVLAFRHSDSSWWLGRHPEREQLIDLVSHLECFGPGGLSQSLLVTGEPSFTPEKDGYLSAVSALLGHIGCGDIYQANMTRQIVVPAIVFDAAGLYLKLREHNPAPFSMALKVGHDGPWILSSSPERFLQIKDGTVEVRPIKGTAARGTGPREDRRQGELLLESVKDGAELAMIVDVLRNDIGRVCDYGSVRVTSHRELESYARVHHLVSTIKGRLRPDLGAVDVLEAAFPGGSISGAPKIKAMELLAGLEPIGRGVYTGAMGYIDCRGGADFNIAIRTMVAAPDRVSFGVGGGIVADSDPESERQETLQKARALFDALGLQTPDM